MRAPLFAAAGLLAAACSREPASLEDWWPDGQGERRVFEVLESGAQRGFHTLRTTGVSPDEGRGRALFFLDPRHRDWTGDYHLVLFENRLSLRMTDLACTLEVFRHPPTPGESWSAGPGVTATVEALETVETPAGRFEGAARMAYRLEPGFFPALGLEAPPEPLEIDVWFAPFEGPVRLTAAGWHEERLVERR